MTSPSTLFTNGDGSFPLTDLPEVPLDKVVSYLNAEDLRTFHRVSRGWKAALESRRKDNERRLELVQRIKENKENLSMTGGPVQVKKAFVYHYTFLIKF